MLVSLRLPARTARRFTTAVLTAAALAAVALTAASPLRAGAQHATRSSSALPSIPQLAVTAGQFNTLLAAVEAAGLTKTLLGKGPFTLFAPTDEAFGRLDKKDIAALLKPENREQLRTLLTYHVVSGRVTAAQARRAGSAETVAGPAVRISTRNGNLRINDATVRIADIPASNGVVHVIDRVLMPSAAVSDEAKAAVSLVDFAVSRGAPLFNDGQPAATVAVYEVAVTGLLALDQDVLTRTTQRSLERALAARSRSDRDRAVALRRALDDARRTVSGEMRLSSR